MTTHRIAHLLAADANWPQSRPVVSWDVWCTTDRDRGFLMVQEPLFSLPKKVAMLSIAVAIIAYRAWKMAR